MKQATYQVCWVLSVWLIGSSFARSLVAEIPEIATGCRAEWEPARIALVHTPGQELFYGVVHPAAALFERPFSASLAADEHRKYVAALEKQGVQVIQLKDAVLAGTIDKHGNPIEGDALAELRRFAFRFVKIKHEPPLIAARAEAELKAYFDESFSKLHPEELWATIVLNPEITLRSTGDLNTGVVADYAVRPLMNLYFMRDQVITTAKGVVVGRMNSEQRQAETDIVRFALPRIGVRPIGMIEEPGRLEGGDFLPAGARVFLGEGLRTNAAAVQQLLDADAFGVEEVVIVKDPWQQQEQMHLDTFFNLVSPTLALLSENRIHRPGQIPTVDVYRKENGHYIRKITGKDFSKYLADIGIKVIPVSREDQLNYACNVLTVQGGDVFMVDGASQTLLSALSEAGVTVRPVDFWNLTGGYGACHCCVQVLLRRPDIP